MYEASAALIEAARDYRWLLDRGYPTAAALKLVGDRLRLDREERIVLFRGIAPSLDSGRRRTLIASGIEGRPLLLDAYNQIFTVMHYLAGRPVFVSSDGLLRDAGGSHGRISDRDLFARALELVADRIAALGPSSVRAVFDSPVAGSALHARFFREAFSTSRRQGLQPGPRSELPPEEEHSSMAGAFPVETALERSADAPLKLAAEGEVVATGDSAIVDALVAKRESENREAAVFDLARSTIEDAFGPRPWLDLGVVLG